MQELGDKQQQLSSLGEQIAAADAAFQALKTRRNAAQDAKKDAWREADDVQAELKATEEEYNRAHQVSVASQVYPGFVDALGAGSLATCLIT